MKANGTGQAALLGGLIALGLIWGGSYLKDAVHIWKQADRVVSVKGLAEREVQADLVLWPLSFSVAADSLEGLYDAIDRDRTKITAFLLLHGFDQSELSFSAPTVQDVWASQYGEQRAPQRYRADAVLLVRSNKVEGVKIPSRRWRGWSARGCC
ncbi:SIMPL domain-containing protein [Oceanimonas sp. NS1]|nr:SIMPL domain-containing protein [Oceanimonas sp. NS1]